MLRSKYRFSLDIKWTQSQVSIPVLLNDTLWGFYISLIDDGKPYLLPDGCRAVFVAKKPDSNFLLNDCIIEKNNIVRYDFTAQTTNVAGITPCEIRVYGPNGRMLTCPRFTMVVDSRVLLDDEIIFSESEKTTIDSIIASEYARQQAELERKSVAQRAKEAVEKAETAVKNAEDALNDANTAIETANTASKNAEDAAERAVAAETAATDGIINHNQDEDAHPAIVTALSDALTSHNTGTVAHNDIRVLLAEINTKLTNFLGLTDHPEALDELSELIDAITNNEESIEALTVDKVKYADIIDNLETNLANKTLSAAQGVVLKGLLDALTVKVTTFENAKPDMSGYVTTSQLESALGAYITDIDNLVGEGITTPTIKGVWLFDESIGDSGEAAGTYTVNFSSYAFPFTTMDLTYEGYGYTISYDNTAVMTGASGADSGYWNIEEYRTVDFGDTEQIVPEAFLAFMQAHATKLSDSSGGTG